MSDPLRPEETEGQSDSVASESAVDSPVVDAPEVEGVGDDVASPEADVPAPADEAPADAVPVKVADENDDDDEWEDYDDQLDGDVEVEPLEEFLEDDDDAKADGSSDWYILKVQVNRETSIADALRRSVMMSGMEPFFQEIVVPTEDVVEFTKSGKRRTVKRKLYPGYIMVKMILNDDTWFLVRDTSGIGDFTGSAGKPTPMSIEEVNRIIKPETEEGEEDETADVRIAIPFRPGDQVRVKEGYFQNFEGEVESIDETNGRVTVIVSIFGRSTPVDMQHWQMEGL
jgi:transcriptional antiterminator NusG